MKRICIIILALITSLTVAAQTIKSKDDLPVVNRQQYLTYISNTGNVEVEDAMNQKLADISAKIGGDAVMLITNVSLYDGQAVANDFYEKNNYNRNCGVIILIDYVTKRYYVSCFGSLQGRREWVEDHIDEGIADKTLKTKGDFWNYIIDNVAAKIADKQNGSWQVYEAGMRTETDPKVHKSFLQGKLTAEQLRLALETPYVDTSAKIYDAAGLLDDDEYQKLQKKAHDFVDKYNIDLVIVTLKENNKKSYNGNIAAENYAMDFYEYNDFGKGQQTKEGYDGVILLVDMQNRDFSILDVGMPNEKLGIAIKNVDWYISKMAPHLTAKEYYKAFTMFIDMYATDFKDAFDRYNAEIEYIKSLPENKWDKYIIAERSESDMKLSKSFLQAYLTPLQQEHALATPYVDTTVKVYDAGGLLTDQEIAELQNRIRRFINTNGIDMVVVTVSRNDTRPTHGNNATETFAMDFYDYNDFGKGEQSSKGYDGVILAIDMQNRTFSILDIGKWGGIDGVAAKKHRGYIEMMSPFLKNKEYKQAISQFIDQYEKDYQYEIAFPWVKCSIYALLIAFFLLRKELKRYKLANQPISAVQYVVPGSFNLIKRVDELIDSKTTSVYNPPASTYHSSSRSSYHSSGSSHRSSSGRSFGGGSGKF